MRTKWVLAALALATVCAACFVAATPPHGAWLLAWLAFAPMYFLIDRSPTTGRAVFCGWWFGFIAMLGGFYWVTPLMERFGSLPMPAAAAVTIVMCAYQGLTYALWAGVTHVVRARTNLPMALIGTVCMVTFEWALPLVFPYYVGFALAFQPRLIQIADLGGPIAVTALVMLVNGAVYDAASGIRRRTVSVSVCGLLAAVCVLYGEVRVRQVSQKRAAARTIKVGLVQPNVAFAQKRTHPRKQLHTLHQKSRELARAGAELIIWSETAYPYEFSRAAPRAASAEYPYYHGFNVPLLLGARTVEAAASAEKEAAEYNSALMFDGTRQFVGGFDKNFLMVLGEYTPGLATFPSMREWLPEGLGTMARGQKVAALPLTTKDGREWRVAPTICYEDLLPSFGRRIAELRPHLLVNLSNDIWFGDTSAPWQHLALSVFRAVELRTDFVRAANSGVSAFIDAAGYIHAKTAVTDPSKSPRGAETLLVPVALVEGGNTMYALIGDAFAHMCAASTLWLWLLRPMWMRYRSQNPQMGKTLSVDTGGARS